MENELHKIWKWFQIFLLVNLLLLLINCPDKPVAPKPAEIKITDPENGVIKDRIFTTSGTCSNVPDGYIIWLVVRPQDENLWYPQGSSRSKEGTWSSNTIIGRAGVEGEKDKGKKFYLIALIVKENGSLGRGLLNALNSSGYITPDPLNPDIKKDHEIYVIRG